MQVYKTTNLITGKWYIGKDETDRDYYIGSGKALINAVKKYGKEKFKKEILEECKSREELNDREAYWIDITNAQKDRMSYNIGAGGIGGDWTVGFTNEKVKEIYKKRGNQTDNFKGAKKLLESLSNKEKKEHYRKQGDSCAKIWCLNHIDNPEKTIIIRNFDKWRKEMGFATIHLTYPGSRHKGWKIWKYGTPEPNDYIDNRSERTSILNTKKFKGRSWKMINNKRVWFDKEVVK